MTVRSGGSKSQAQRNLLIGLLVQSAIPGG